VTETGIVDEAVPEPRPIELPEVPVEVPLLSRYTAREMVSEKDGVGRTVHYDPANPDIQLTTGWPEDGYLGGTLEVLDDISNIGGKGSATAAYIKGLKEAADRGLGWRSEGILSDASHRMYARLGELGFDVQPHGAGYIISEDSIRKTLDGPPKAPEPRPIELPEVPVEYRDPPPAEEGPWAETVDTRGQGVQYHGTSTPLDGTDNSYYSTMNIYGQGFYTSDAGDIVRGYSKKGKGGQPTLYTVTPNRALNIYDMELPLVDTMKDILRGMNDDGFNDLLDEFPDISLRELYDERRVYDEFEPADEVQEIFTAVRDTLEDAGFDGLTHVGGKRTGKSAHNVEIYFNPKDDLNMELVEPPKAPEPRPIELPEVRTSPEWEEYTASRDIPIPQLIEYGDGVNSPYLLADGKVTGSSGDHLDAIGVYFDSTGVDVPDLNYETFQKATGSIRAMFYRQNGEYNITLQLFGDQKLTPNQVATLRAIEAGAEDPVRVSVGISEEGAGGTNPPYSAPTTLEEAIALHSAPPEPKAPETQPRTLGEAYAKMDADTEITMKDLDNYWECRNG
jgi:hypothetical protein